MELSTKEKLLASSALEYTLTHEFGEEPIEEYITNKLELLTQSEYSDEEVANLSNSFTNIRDKIIDELLDQ